jgi:subtilisin family serine protease
LDGGVDGTHPELKGRVFVGHSILDGEVGNFNTDLNGHGTLCAGIIAGKTVGIAPKATVISMQVVGPNDKGRISDIIKALEHIAKNVISIHVRASQERLLYQLVWVEFVYIASPSSQCIA